MKRLLRFLLFQVLLFSVSLSAQQTYTGITPGQKTFRSYLAVGVAGSYSVINNRKEVRGQYKPGVNVNAAWFTSPWFCFSADYTSFFPHNASPAFENIRSWNTELNGNLIMNVGDSKLCFKTLFGVSYMSWQGTFIGPSLNDNNKYYYGLLVKQDWVAANLGCGFTHTITGNLNASFDFRMRFASEKKDLISISDTGFFLGVQWQVKGHPYDGDDNHKARRKTTKGRPGRLYKWMKKGAN